MNARKFILTELRSFVFHEPDEAKTIGFTIDDDSFLHACVIRDNAGDSTAWDDLLARIRREYDFALAVWSCLERSGYVWLDFDELEDDCLRIGDFPTGIQPITSQDEEEFLSAIWQQYSFVDDQTSERVRDSRTQIMYIESKPDLNGEARIGRVTFSKTRRTIYYRKHKFRSLKGGGYKANFRNVETGMWYWISSCHRDGQDRLYPGNIEVDEDVRQEYWTSIRKRPDLVQLSSFRSEGKYTRRKPQTEKPNHPERRRR